MTSDGKVQLNVLIDPTATRDRAAGEINPLARFPEEWAEVLSAAGERPFRGKQIFRWLHARGVVDSEKMTDLSLELRQKLVTWGVAPIWNCVDSHRAVDGTRKLVLELSGGARVECVLIPMTAKADRSDDAMAPIETDEDEEDDEEGEAPVPFGRTRVTLCVSTQYGCAMGCVFCASGRAGLSRGLGAGEIVAQVLEARRHLLPGEELTNLVFMGMGEPLHHYDETARAIRLLTHPEGLGMAARRITVSTVGLVRGIERLGADFDGKVGLAVSLHAPNDALRSRIVPMNEKIPLQRLLAAIRAYPLPRRRRITIEYTLLAGINDQQAQARELAQLLRGLRVKINLIPMNAVEGAEYRGSSSQWVQQFKDWLVSAGYSCFVRTRRGDEVLAACGQLAFQPGPLPDEAV